MNNPKIQGTVYALLFIVIFGGLGALVYYSSDISGNISQGVNKDTKNNLNQQAMTSSYDLSNMPAFSTQTSANAITTKEGLIIDEVQVGTGAEAKAGDFIDVHYSGYLLDGTNFDNSYKRGEPIRFQLGVGRVIQGWDQGVAGMKVGGKRKLIIPASLGYGPQGHPPVIPANATLVFDVELVGVDQK